MQTTKTIDLIYFDAGGGHRSAALALQSVIAGQGRNWRVRMVNLQKVLDELDVFRKVTGTRLEDVYNLALAKGWTLGSTWLLPLMHGIIRAYHPGQVKLLKAFWQQDQPDMVVSLVPNFNRALFQSLAQALPCVPLVTILTDFADYPPHFWIEKQAQYLICGTAKAAQQALAMGYPDERVFRTSGMILRPEFYDAPVDDRAAGRIALGLDPEKTTGVVLFGGEGSNVMRAIAERLGKSAIDLQLIMLCGRNESLRTRLGKMDTRNKIVTQGFTKEIPRYMGLGDFFIGKPGPGSISEAVQMRLPVIVERNSWTLPQERYNADWVQEQGVGVVLENFREIEKAVGEMLADGRLQAMREKTATLRNRAVFEIPPILEGVLEAKVAQGVALRGAAGL